MTAASWVARPLPAGPSYVVWPAAREVHKTSNAEEPVHRRDSSGARIDDNKPLLGRGPNGKPSSRRHGLDAWSFYHESVANLWRGAKVGRSVANLWRRPFLPTPVLRIGANPRDQRKSSELDQHLTIFLAHLDNSQKFHINIDI